MKASLHSARIAPKKANVVAKMVRGMTALEAIELLERTHKKGARMIEELLKSAVANATHNDKQDAKSLVIRSIVVNQGMGYRRGVPMARGRIRPMTKFLSHIDVVLGVKSGESDQKPAKKTAKVASTKPKTRVQKSAKTKTEKDTSAASSASSTSASS